MPCCTESCSETPLSQGHEFIHDTTSAVRYCVLVQAQEHATQSFLEVLSAHLGDGSSCRDGDRSSGSRDKCLLGDLRPYFITNVGLTSSPMQVLIHHRCRCRVEWESECGWFCQARVSLLQQLVFASWRGQNCSMQLRLLTASVYKSLESFMHFAGWTIEA